ncbi:MAG TPA: ADP-forming succinate--CoA ligase subunit beta [Planctomycetota bacterium]|nr:ADP-forming succinate--CoA ligase subunit beta [Planctomycetota bacterium]
MKVHEFQAKALFRQAGIPVPAGEVAVEPAQAAESFARLGAPLAVVKAQIHAGGRGKAGGVKLVRSAAEAASAAAALLGQPLVTIQTGPKGQLVRRVLVEAGTEIAHEYYAAITVDRSRGVPVLMVSSEGGMDIEEVARRTPERILRETLDAEAGLRPWQARRLAFALRLPAASIKPAVELLRRLARMFLDLDASLVEVNPLVLRPDGQLVALDGKLDFDGNALFRHPELAALRDKDEEDPRELAAAEAGLAYIALEGNIGCLVNGAGLAMGTMDTIQLAGGQPANFLDVGGGATREQVTAAVRIIRSDARVKAVLVNIFGGIMKCDVIAEGLLAALRATGPGVPLVVRLEGTNVERGRQLLEQSGLALITAVDLADAASKAVAAAQGAAAGAGAAR